MMPAWLEARDDADALEMLDSLGCSDGLPMITPTDDRVEAMIAGGHLAGDYDLGSVPPRGAAATVFSVAANSVMAGCSPVHFPVVIAAISAVLEPCFDLNIVQTTTNAVAPLVVVNGPARTACGEIASRHGALGPGHRANAVIGRALRLTLLNVGGGWPGEGDMALFGHGGKLFCCFAEAEEHSPFPPLHVAQGHEASDSVVTVIGADGGPQTVLHIPLADDRQSAEALLSLIALALASPGHLAAYSGMSSPMVILNPDHAHVLHRAGLERSTICDEIAARATNTVERLRTLNPAVVEHKLGTTGPRPDEFVAPACLRDGIRLVVAGGSGNYSAVVHSWGAGPHFTTAVSKRVLLPEAP
jgi:hypothetical protein